MMDDKDAYGRPIRWVARGNGQNRHGRRRAAALRRRLNCPRAKCQSRRVQRVTCTTVLRGGDYDGSPVDLPGVLCRKCGRRSVAKLTYDGTKVQVTRPTVVTSPRAFTVVS